MGVYIKGMKMPQNCMDCDFFESFDDGYYCGVAIETARILSDVRNRRRSDCPLSEIPSEHGDLIDMQKLCKDMFYTKDGKRIPTHDCDNWPVRFDVSDIQNIIRKQPVIIQAESEDA